MQFNRVLQYNLVPQCILVLQCVLVPLYHSTAVRPSTSLYSSTAVYPSTSLYFSTAVYLSTSLYSSIAVYPSTSLYSSTAVYRRTLVLQYNVVLQYTNKWTGTSIISSRELAWLRWHASLHVCNNQTVSAGREKRNQLRPTSTVDKCLQFFPGMFYQCIYFINIICFWGPRRWAGRERRDTEQKGWNEQSVSLSLSLSLSFWSKGNWVK